MTTLPRAATAPELVKLRADNQSAQLYLTIHSPTSIYTAKLAAVPTTTDKVASITYDTGSGTHTNIKADMTMLVGSTAGASDRGIVRIRNTTGIAATTGTFNIGETSQINWTTGDFLTVLDEFVLWPRHVNLASNGTTPLMDYDVAYTNQNVAAGAQPTPIMGPHAVLWKRGATVTYSPDASSSWVKDGTITTYAWVCTGATFDNAASATPVITFSSTGLYRLALTVTGNNAVTFTGYRYIFVVTESAGVTTQFTLDNCSGDTSSGGWQFGVTLYDEATKALIRDRALCILHSVDYYGTTQGSIGYVTGNENIVAIGYIAGESIVRGADDQFGSVSFDVQGPQYWFGKMTAFPSGVKDVSDATTPNKWTKFRGLTLNKAWYHFLAWRTTATRCMDCYPNTDGRRHKRLEAPGGQNIWAQLVEICKRSMLANPLCDRYGRIFCEIEQQLVSDRSGMATVQALTSADWQGELRFDRVTVDEAALIDLSGISWNGTAATPYFALAPGHVFRHYGSVEVVDRLMLTTSQTDTNTLAGLYSAWKNNPYPKVDINLAANQRLIDIAPYQRVTLALASTDTPRGVTEALTLIPRSIAYQFADGVMLTDATFEAEVTAALAVTGDTPVDPPDDPPIDPTTCPPGQHWDGAACVADAPIDPPLASDAHEAWFATSTAIYWSGDYFNGGQPTWNKVAGLPNGDAIVWMGMTFNGSMLYLATATGAVTIWKCANPKAVTPTWTNIFEVGTVIGAYTASQYFSYVAGPFVISGTKLVTTCHISRSSDSWAYGEYDGVTWTWDIMPYQNIFQPNGVGFDTWLDAGNHVYDGTGSLLETAPNVLDGYEIWHRAGLPRYGIRWLNSPNRLYLRTVGGAVNQLLGTPVAAAQILSSKVTGAENGLHVYCVADLNAYALWAAADGVTFTHIADWLPGRVLDATYSGGGSLFWLPKTVAANNVVSRLYTQAGAIVPDVDGNGDRTGNFWSLTTGDQTIVGSGLVYI